MSCIAFLSAPPVLQQYYRILTGGAQAYGQGEGLRPLLSDHLDFTGSLAGHRPDSTAGFLHGVAGFIATVSTLEVVHEVHDGYRSAVSTTPAFPMAPSGSPSSSP